MILVIAEKPALGQAIADAIPGKGIKKDGTITKGEYVIIWAFGHLLTIKEPEDYDDKYKSWNLEDLPIYFEPWGHKPGKTTKGMASKSERIKQISKLLKEADSVIHAGDVDEEGQLLIDELLRWCKYTGPVKRLDTSNTTVPALKKALKQMKDNKSCESDGWSAFGRELSDAIFGFNLTRYYSLKNKTFIPVGRVQTPTLGMVVHRDELVENHQKLHYFELFADLQVAGSSIQAKFIPNPDDPNLTDSRILDSSILQSKLTKIKNATYNNIVIKKGISKEAPPLPFNLTKLNIYCSRKWGYNPDAVMKITQRLRDEFNAITYNRSDCQYLSEEHYKAAPENIRITTQNLGLKASDFDPTLKSKCFNDANITAHFAIIPSGAHVDVSKMSTQEKNVYTAICHYFLAQFLPAAEREKTTLDVDLGNGESLHAVGSTLVKAGYLSLLSGADDSTEISEEKDGESVALCNLAEGCYSGQVTGTDIRQRETKPPVRYTQATLIEDMTRVAKFVDDPEIKALLIAKDRGKKGENGSIGTSATRPAIIKNLISRGLLNEQKKGKSTYLVSTPKGRAFYQMLPDNIKKADTTARWWVMQEDIKTGAASPESMARNVLEEVKVVLRSSAGTLDNSEAFVGGGTGVVVGKCPLCGNDVVERQKSYSCSTKDCKVVFFKENRLLQALGKQMSIPVAKALLSEGRVRLDNCKSKTGNKYSCFLIVNYDTPGKYPEFKIEMPGESDASTQNSLGRCPLCGRDVIKDSYGNYSCSGRTTGCNFRIFSSIASRKLSEANIKELLTKGRTKTLSNFKSKAGKTFDAALLLKPDGSIQFHFEDKPRRK